MASSSIMAELLKSHYLLFVVQRMLNYLPKEKADILVSMISKGVNKLKDKKVSISRWSAFLDKYSGNLTSSKGHFRVNSKDTFGSDNNLFLKHKFSPELAPSNILSPPLNPYLYSHVNHPFSPNLLSTPYRNISLINQPSMIKPGLVNPLNRFRPNPNYTSSTAIPQQNFHQGSMGSPNYLIINSNNNNYNEVISNQTYNAHNSPTQYYMSPQIPYINYVQQDPSKMVCVPRIQNQYSNNQAQHCLSPYISKISKN